MCNCGGGESALRYDVALPPLSCIEFALLADDVCRLVSSIATGAMFLLLA